MSQPKVLVCPSCGAKLNITGNEVQVKCDYCATPVIVPDELRNKKPEPDLMEALREIQQRQPVVVVQQAPPVTRNVYVPVRATSGGSGLFGCLVTFVLIGGVFAFILYQMPQSQRNDLVAMFQNATKTGFATQVASFGGEGTGPWLFQSVQHVAVDGKGDIYVSDLNTLRIQHFDATGKFQNMWTIDEKNDFAGKNGPSKLVADKDGNVYAIYGSLLLKYEGSSGKLVGKFVGETTNAFLKWTENFKDLVVLPNGNLLALSDNQNSDDLVKLDPNGKILSRVKKIVSTPKDDSLFIGSLHLAADGLGNIYIIDDASGKTAVYKFNPDGKYVNRFGSNGKEAGQFQAFNSAIAVDGKGRVYVKDWNNIFVFDSTGRYINLISGGEYDNSINDFAIGYDNAIYVVGYKNKVYKLAVNEPAK